jgi:hypothetical protein
VRLDGDDHTARQARAQYSSTSAHALQARSSLRSVHSTGSPSPQKLTYDRAGGKILYHTSRVSHASCRSAWATLIAKVYEINPLLCPRCGSEMRPIAVITNPWSGHCTDPDEVRKILRHPVGGALRHPLRIGMAPPGLDTSTLN